MLSDRVRVGLDVPFQAYADGFAVTLGERTFTPPVHKRDSEEVLIAVWELLEEHPEITQLRVEGHTDNKGDAAKNRALSQKRAQAVVEWLTKAGITASHLSSAGFGPDRPIADNATDQGRQQNRRVEFHIENEKGN